MYASTSEICASETCSSEIYASEIYASILSVPLSTHVMVELGSAWCRHGPAVKHCLPTATPMVAE